MYFFTSKQLTYENVFQVANIFNLAPDPTLMSLEAEILNSHDLFILNTFPRI